MAYDAAQVWWPPLARLHAALASAAGSAPGRAPSPRALAAVLDGHHRYLASGLALFRPSSDDAAAALAAGGRLPLDGRAIDVDARLVPAALDVAAVAVSGRERERGGMKMGG
jgi:hypothetical protein